MMTYKKIMKITTNTAKNLNEFDMDLALYI